MDCNGKIKYQAENMFYEVKIRYSNQKFLGIYATEIRW